MSNHAKFEQLDKFRDDLDKCTKCGFCMFHCPVYREERIESSVARGKVMLVRSLLSGELKLSDEMAEHLNKCTLCLTCAESCPSGAPVPDVITAARADKVKQNGLTFPYNIIFRWLLPRRRLFGYVVKIASWFQAIFLPKTEGNIRHLSFFLAALGKGRHIPQIAPKFLRQSVPEVNHPPEGIAKTLTVGYFTGCMTDFVFPDLGKRIIKFLTGNGVEVIVPRHQGCCGAPVFLGVGDFATGRNLADNNVRAFRDVEYVITDCATCASAMKDYVKYLADTPERIREYIDLAGKIKDITEFLVDIFQLQPSSYRVAPQFRGKRVTWHDPCHLGRYLGIKEQPRQILKSLPDIEYIEMPEADRCCGMAGTFSLGFYDLSRKIARRKLDSLVSTGADIVLTGCPGCQVQLLDGITQNGMPQKVMHIMELFE